MADRRVRLRRITSYNVCYTKLLRFGWTWLFWVPLALAEQGIIKLPANLPPFLAGGNLAAWGPLLASLLLTYLNRGREGLKDFRITSYNVCYTKLLRSS